MLSLNKGGEVMKKYEIRDNRGETFDRYTLITSDGSLYGFSDDPYNPLGFGQYCGEVTDSKQRANIAASGKLISINDLPIEAQRFVKERII